MDKVKKVMTDRRPIPIPIPKRTVSNQSQFQHRSSYHMMSRFGDPRVKVQ
jgi:hypothetical protein